MSMVALVVIALTLLGGLVVLVAPRRNVAWVGFAAILLNLVLIPTFGPSGAVRLGAVLSCLLVTLIMLSRWPSRTPQPGSINIPLCMYLLWTTAVTAVTSEADWGLLRVATCVLLLLLMICLSRLAPPYFGIVAIAAVIGIQLLLGMLEAFTSLDALWPRPDGSDRIESRVNQLAPWLPGRVLGSTAGPIPYGTLAGLGILIAAWAIASKNRKSFWFLLVASVGMLLLSGTRSAAVAVIIVVAAWLLLRSTSSRLLSVGVIILTCIIALGYSGNAFSVLGLGNVDSTTSFLHRISVLSSVGALLEQQQLAEILFGNGERARDLILSGVVASSGGVTVFDNQLVRELASSGLVGLLLLLAALVRGFRLGDGASRLLLAFIAIMFFSFDALTWNVILFFFVAAGSIRMGDGVLGQESDLLQPAWTSPRQRGIRERK